MITLDSALKAKASRLTIDGLKNEGEVCVCGVGGNQFKVSQDT